MYVASIVSKMRETHAHQHPSSVSGNEIVESESEPADRDWTQSRIYSRFQIVNASTNMSRDKVAVA